jgi:uncharacterized RDD family membrane protein YckC
MKKKITDLTEERTYYKRGTDIAGNRTKEPYQARVKRPVQTVTGWPRFGHYLVDLIIIYGINFVIGLFMGLLAPELVFSMPDIVWNLISMLIVAMYYFAVESTMGTSIGKLVTNSVVIDEYGDKPNSSALLGRSFSRIIPFEAFSCLAERGWHDKFSNTFVVTKAEHVHLQRQLSEQAGEFYVDQREDILD